ncbi:AlpA family transcriptional regulator [Sinimarinibacterium flocculans]|uniref:AlpA family transcriptional regulator n=2 Tax=Sinimarinibacterium flocculans TaxID=985250 RepID=A0A318EFH0_9GAMM|nr:AlpA family transcriptional regulator [Sinimarinibacterium flocculans]
MKRTGLGRSTVYAEVARRRFPSPVRLTARSVGWVESEVVDWIDQRIRDRIDMKHVNQLVGVDEAP